VQQQMPVLKKGVPVQAKTLPAAKSPQMVQNQSEEPKRKLMKTLVMSKNKEDDEDNDLTQPIQQQSAGDYVPQSIEGIVKLLFKIEVVAISAALPLEATRPASRSEALNNVQ